MECLSAVRFPCLQSKPIWIADAQNVNQYVQFAQKFNGRPDEKVSLYIACDSRGAVYLNGKLLGFLFYDGTEHISCYETFDLKGCLRDGENELQVNVWYQGIHTNNYTCGRAQLLYGIRSCGTEGTVLACSGEKTVCRRDLRYTSGSIPGNQVGLIWYWDQTAALPQWEPVRCLAEDERKFMPRPILRQILSGRKNAHVCAHGYLLPGDKAPFEARFLSARLRGADIEKSRPYYEIWDCGEISTGLLELEVQSEKGCRIEIGWGEHLEDLRVRSHVGDRWFQTSATFSGGRNTFRHDFQRVGFRYLELHVFPAEGDMAHCRYAGLRPLDYPVEEKGEFLCEDHLHRKICETAVRTLRMCMHEHYEDCPWREQALYAMDSLNQAVCGYYCFGEYDFPAASLAMLGSGMQKDGFLELHTPGKDAICIPYFTFMWVVAVREHLYYSGDIRLAKSMWKTVRKAVDSRLKELDQDLLPIQTGVGYWSFYEWNDLLSGEPIRRTEPLSPRIDAPYQLFFLQMLQAAADLAEIFREQDYAQLLLTVQERVKKAFSQLFWKEADGSFSTFAYPEGDHYCAGTEACSELVQALAVLTGAADHSQTDRILPDLAGGRMDWVPCTLSMIRYKYEALLTEPTQYQKLVFDHIAAVWGKMLYAGATTFWETADGADAFDDAGSLCHGWSAMPIFFYYAYWLGIRPKHPGFAEYCGNTELTASAGRSCGCIPTPWGKIYVRSNPN